jgi:hypothetical protein
MLNALYRGRTVLAALLATTFVVFAAPAEAKKPEHPKKTAAAPKAKQAPKAEKPKPAPAKKKAPAKTPSKPLPKKIEKK